MYYPFRILCSWISENLFSLPKGWKTQICSTSCESDRICIKTRIHIWKFPYQLSAILYDSIKIHHHSTIRHSQTLPPQPNTIAIPPVWNSHEESFRTHRNRCEAPKCCIICWLIVVVCTYHIVHEHAHYLRPHTQSRTHTNDTHLSYRRSMQIFLRQKFFNFHSCGSTRPTP